MVICYKLISTNLMNNLMLKIPFEIILKAIYYIVRRLAVVKFPSKLRQ